MEDNYIVTMLVLFIFGTILCIIGNVLAICLGIFMIVASMLMVVFSTTDKFYSSFIDRNRRVNWNFDDFIEKAKVLPRAWWHSVLPKPGGWIERVIVRMRQRFNGHVIEIKGPITTEFSDNDFMDGR